MKRLPGLLALLLLAALCIAPAIAGTPPGDLLMRRVTAAVQRVPYSGKRMTTLWLERRTEGVESIESADGHGRSRIQYLAPAAARGRVWIDDGKQHWQIEPHGGRIFRAANALQAADPAWDLALLLANYRVVVDPRLDNIARRPAYKITLIPRHAGKPRTTLWADTRTSLLLKREARHADGAPARTTAFTEINLHPRMPRSFYNYRPPVGSKIVDAAPPARPINPARAQKLLGAARPFPQWIAALGFQLRGAFVPRTGKQASGYLVYEDGLVPLTVFIDKQTNRVALSRGRRHSVNGHPAWLRTDHHFGTLRWAANGLRYTIVGDLSETALLKMGQALPH